MAGPEADPLIARFKRLVLRVAARHGIKVLSIVLYGSRAYGNPTSHSDYDFFVLLDDKVSLFQFTQFSGELRLLSRSLDRRDRIKVYANTVGNVRKIMESNPLLGAFCYVISSMGLPIYDPEKVYGKLKAEVEALPVERKKAYVKACIEVSRRLGSRKWVKYWQERLKEFGNV